MIRVCARRADGTADNKAAVEPIANAERNADSLRHVGNTRCTLCLDTSAEAEATPGPS